MQSSLLIFLLLLLVFLKSCLRIFVFSQKLYDYRFFFFTSQDMIPLKLIFLFSNIGFKFIFKIQISSFFIALLKGPSFTPLINFVKNQLNIYMQNKFFSSILLFQNSCHYSKSFVSTPAPFVEMIFFPPLNCLSNFVKTKLLLLLDFIFFH